MLRRMLTVSASMSLLIMSMASPVWAEADSKTYVLDLHDAMIMATEYSQDIKDIESQQVTLDETIRSGLSTKNQIAFVVEDYEDFVDKWFDDDGDYDKYKDMSTTELQTAYIDLSMSQARASVYMYPEKVKQVNRDLEFIKYMFMFGTDEPDLTSEEIYTKYEKNALAAELQSKAGVEKTLNMIDMIKGNLESGVLQLYVGILELDNGIELSEQNITLLEKINADNQEMYNQGQISKVDLEVNSLELEVAKHELDKLKIQRTSTLNSLKAVLGVQVDSRVVLLDDVDVNGFFDNVTLDEEITLAQNANADVKSYQLDFDIIESNFDLYNAYSGRTFGSEYESLSDSYEEASDNLRDNLYTVEANVRYAYDDVLAKIQSYNNSKMDFGNAEQTYINTKASFDQGLVTTSQLNSASLLYQSKVNSMKSAERALQSAIMKYEILTEKGILY